MVIEIYAQYVIYGKPMVQPLFYIKYMYFMS